MKKLMTAALAATCLSLGACSGLTQHSMWGNADKGYFTLASDEAGLRAFGDTLNGLVVTGKAAPNVEDTYHTLRRVQEHEKTQRHMAQSLKKLKSMNEK